MNVYLQFHIDSHMITHMFTELYFWQIRGGEENK